MQMIVLYGIGSLELNKNSRLQLSLAILMQKHFNWIGDIQVFDPVLSVTECRVIKAFGCSILSLHQYRRWRALKPTLFFMPHCSSMLYSDFLKANWESSLLSNIVLFANSFNEYARKDPYRDLDSMWYLYGARRFTKELRMNITFDEDYYNAFHRLTWHFFSQVKDAQLQSWNKFMNELSRRRVVIHE
ncbi:hypothetical protein QN277_012055 [Acacia crassicarpa]|uniref:SRR1-like domain-containing protein n=1 Tax=Acacia crassicarpa TaxID=499986 RepID=A0AAE1TE43_9FABA|nr:hypothetical protein QN277_012055 [Acacia crassicarpa]